MKNRILSILFLLLASPPAARATWFGENVEKGADIMMMDLRYPFWAESTYNAHWNFSLLAPDHFSGYGGFSFGIESLPPDHRPNLNPRIQDAFRPGSVWSFWGADKKGEPVRVVMSSRFNYPRQYIGEGASGALGGPVWPIVRNRWYTMLMRLWRPLGPEREKVSYIGRWVKDTVTRRWYLYGVVRVPTPATGFRGNAGFLEDFWFNGRSVRSLHRRLGYYRKDGTWRRSDTVTYKVPERGTYWVVNKIEGGTVLAMELSSNPSLLPFRLKGKILEPGKTHSFTIAEPPKPKLDEPGVDSVEAFSNGRQVLVTWKIPSSSSPPFQYKVEIFRDPSCKGKPVASREERMPFVREVLLPAELENPVVRLTLTDVFDQTLPPVIVRAARLPEAEPAPPARFAPGLGYALFVKDRPRRVNVFLPPCEECRKNREEKHYWVSLSELKEGRLLRRGITNGFNLGLRESRHSGFGFEFKGLLRVPKTGIYLFHMRGTDGYRIRIDGREALLFDGLHGPEPRTFWKNLSAGAHRLEVDYFFDAQKPFFELEWEGPGLSRRKIPHSALGHEPAEPIPSTEIVSAKPRKDGFVEIDLRPVPGTARADKVQLFLDKMRIAELDPSSLHYSGLLPAGRHRLWTRTWFRGNHTADSEPIALDVPQAPVSGWKLGVAGEARATHNLARTGPGSFTFIGEGEFVLYRQVKGDFTLTCRVDRCLGRKGEPVNPSSSVGLTICERSGKGDFRRGRSFGVFLTARHGLRTTPDFDDLGGTRISKQKLPDNHRWIRVVRRGNVWSAWTSADGKTWRFGTSSFIHARPEVGAGIFFRALPQNALVFFQAAVSHLSLEPGLPPGEARVEAIPAGNTKDLPWTGVVVAPSDPRVVVLRSPGRGLLRSTDGGKTWKHADGGLSGPALAVRSVAVHPSRPEVMLRASGTGKGPGQSGLYLTEDGGAHWKKLDFPGDFDGLGPSSICGEIIAFHPAAPDCILVGTESSGLFRSTDGGLTWRRVLPGGQRFTALALNTYSARKDGRAMIHAVTCPDAAMSLLGRGSPSTSTSAREGRDYFSGDGGRRFSLQCARPDLGYLNLLFPAPQRHGYLLYGTTQGLLFTYRNGRMTHLYSSHPAVERLRPMTALASGYVKDQSWPRTYVQVLDPAVPGRVSCSFYHGNVNFQWIRFSPKDGRGVVAISPCDMRKSAKGDLWWFLTPDGLHRLDDEALTFVKVL